jgi:hypothetical protein
MALHFLSIVFIAATLLRSKELLQFLIRESSVKARKFEASFKMGVCILHPTSRTPHANEKKTEARF